MEQVRFQFFLCSNHYLLHVYKYHYHVPVNPRPANYRVRNEGGFGGKWLRNSSNAKAPTIKANLVSERVHSNFNTARSRVALSSSGSSTRCGVNRYTTEIFFYAPYINANFLLAQAGRPLGPFQVLQSQLHQSLQELLGLQPSAQQLMSQNASLVIILIFIKYYKV